MKQLFLPAVLITIGAIGCESSSDSVPNGTRNGETPPAASASQLTETDTASTSDSSPETSSDSNSAPPPDKSLIDAAGEGNLEAVQQHITAGANLNQQHPQNGSTALIAAASFGHSEVALFLMESGADLGIKNNEGSTALHTAAFLCHEKIVEALLEKGADRNARNKAGATALDSVKGPFEEVKPIYDLLLAILGPYGLELDYEFIKETRPKITKMLQAG